MNFVFTLCCLQQHIHALQQQGNALQYDRGLVRHGSGERWKASKRGCSVFLIVSSPIMIGKTRMMVVIKTMTMLDNPHCFSKNDSDEEQDGGDVLEDEDDQE